MSSAFRAIVRSAFRPSTLPGDQKAFAFVVRYGWILVPIRWGYYALIFAFRDYEGKWVPFVPPPFGLDVATYGKLQSALALPFGVFLMVVMAGVLAMYLRLRGKRIEVRKVVNILGAAFFLPFVIVQPMDQIIVHTIGWKLVPVSLVHTLVLFWESLAATLTITAINQLKTIEKVTSVLILMATWMLVTAPVWR